MKFVRGAACVWGALTVCIPLAQCSSPHFMRRNSYLPAWVMSQLSGERMYQMLASLSEKERNRFRQQVQANPTFKGVERLQEEPSASTELQRSSPQLLRPRLRRRGRTRWQPRTCRCPLQVRKWCTRLWSRRRLHSRPLQLPAPLCPRRNRTTGTDEDTSSSIR